MSEVKANKISPATSTVVTLGDSSDTFVVTTGAKLDINGTELILDADADTSITADTDDQIDFKISGADDFRMTANNFNVLSGSTLTIDSGATITNSGTVTGFPEASEAAYAGVLQTNANFVDQVIFGPSVDGKPWNGLWNKASLFSSLMLATIEDEGSNTEVNIWDLTEQTSGAISTTPLATIDLADAATPTCVEAIMGYVFVGSEDGFAVIDPHDGSWAERTTGWPKTTSTATRPTLAANTVIALGLGYQDKPPYDPRTGGHLPTVAIAYSGGSYAFGIIKYGTAASESPTHYWRAGTGNNAVFDNNRLFVNLGNVLYVSNAADTIVANTPQLSEISQAGSAQAMGLSANVYDGLSVVGNDLALASTTGFQYTQIEKNAFRAGEAVYPANGIVTRTYNTGFITYNNVGVWCANSKTVDRGAHSNTLTENGTVTEAAVESGAELNGYSGWSSSNYLSRASDANWDVITTGEAYLSCWFKSSGSSATESLCGFSNSGHTIRFLLYLHSNGKINWIEDGATANVSATEGSVYDDTLWHKVDMVRVSSTERYLYVDGLRVGYSTTDAGSLSSSGNLPFAIGVNPNGSDNPASTCTISLVRMATKAPRADQIRRMYEAEKGMFVANAECLLQSGSTDGVLDVDIDPLTKKMLVTQTDAITIFDGLVVDSKPTVNSGTSEKGKLWGSLRTEQNSANAYVTAPAVDQRQVNEMVRGLSNDVPADIDLSKAKAWLHLDGTGTIAMTSSYNIQSVTDVGTGSYRVKLAVSFKSTTGFAAFGSLGITFAGTCQIASPIGHAAAQEFTVYTVSHADAFTDNDNVYLVFFGELENE